MKLPLKITVGADGFATVRDAENHRVATDLQPDAAELLATACNAHDQLVAALKAMKEKHLLQYPHHEHLCDVCIAANAALAAAGAA